MAIRDAFAQTQWFRLLSASLARSGVRHVIVSPGSRSTPLVCAFERQPELRITLCIDERAAGFIALGLARATGEPSAVLCTSGTAPAHYFPAVMEAQHSGIPLLIVSADRPAELQANGAAQTTDQTRLFGAHVRGFFDLGTPQARNAALSGLTRKVAQAVAQSRGAHPGPVHINAPAFKPLEPVDSNGDEEKQLEQRVNALIQRSSHDFHAGWLTPSDATTRLLARRWAAARRPLLFCGPSACHDESSALASFASHSGWPVLAEITHPLRQSRKRDEVVLIDAFDLVVREPPDRLQPDLVVSVGATPTSGAWLNWLSQLDAAELDVVAPSALIDPLNRATTVIQCHEQPLFAALGKELPNHVTESRAEEWAHWGSQWQAANDEAQRRVQSYLSLPDADFAEAHVLAEVSKHVRDGDFVMLGNSLPIRLAETFFSAEIDYSCLSQRGVSGIDGLIAGAIGANLGTGRRTWLLLGDVSAVHDLGSLRLLAQHAGNVVVVIIDNDGGRIFDSLPVKQVVPNTTAWTTPHATPFAALAKAFGLPTGAVSTRTELERTLLRLPHTGPFVLWARVAADGALRAYEALGKRAPRFPE